MNSSRILKISGGLIALFVLGSLFGAGVQWQWAAWDGAWRGGWMERWADRLFEKRVVELQLRPEQIATLASARDQMKAELRELQQETTRRAWQILARQNQRIWQQLDESQRQEFRKLQQERRARAAETPKSE
jgi:hypothetical protein